MKRAARLIGVGTRAARRMSSRLRGSRGQAAFWRPTTLHWRRSPSPRAPHPGQAPAGSWTSIFAPRIALHFSSSLSTLLKSTSFAATTSIRHTWLRQRERVLHHRETLREHVLRVRLGPRPRGSNSNPSNVDFVRLARPQRHMDAARPPGSSPRIRPVRPFSVTARSTALTTYISNSFANRGQHSATSFFAGASTTYLRERAPRSRVHPAEPARMSHHIELVWRQPQAAVKAETHAIRASLVETPERSRTAAFYSPNVPEPATKTAHRPAVPAFDAAQMDRFVDTVIQRVEKRVRIERERRGW
jgi:hypothetical protein